MSVTEQVLQLKQDFDDVYEAGYNKGKSEGGDTETAYNQGVADGKQAERNNFWDVFQNYGERFSYDSAFFGLYDQSIHYGWNDETYNPIYPIKLGSENSVVKNYGQKVFYYNTEITDTKVDILVYVNELSGTFTNAYRLKTIKKIILINENVVFNSPFTQCKALENITFEGTIVNSISFADSPLLTAESKQNIIDHLATVTTAQTITFHKDIVLTAEQKATIYGKGWTLAQ